MPRTTPSSRATSSDAVGSCLDHLRRGGVDQAGEDRDEEERGLRVEDVGSGILDTHAAPVPGMAGLAMSAPWPSGDGTGSLAPRAAPEGLYPDPGQVRGPGIA